MMRTATQLFLLISRSLHSQWLTLPTTQRYTWVDPEAITWDQQLSQLDLHQALTFQKVTCGNLTMLKRGKDQEKENFQLTLSTTEGWDTSIKTSWWIKKWTGVQDHQLDQDLQLDKLWLLHHHQWWHHHHIINMPQPSATTNSTENKENRENTLNTKRSNKSIRNNTRSLKYLRESGRRLFQLTELKSSHTSSARGTSLHSELKLKTSPEERKLTNRALQFWEATSRPRSEARQASSIAAKTSWKCSEHRTLTRPRKELKFQSKSKPLELRSQPETKKSESCLDKSTPPSLKTRLLSVKLKPLKWASTRARKSEADNRALSTNRTVHCPSGSKSALLRAHASQFLRRNAIPSLTALPVLTSSCTSEPNSAMTVVKESTSPRVIFPNWRAPSTDSTSKSTTWRRPTACLSRTRSTNFPRTASSTMPPTSWLQTYKEWRLNTTASKLMRGVRTPIWRQSTTPTRPSWTGTLTSRLNTRLSRSTLFCWLNRTKTCRENSILSSRPMTSSEETSIEKKRFIKLDQPSITKPWEPVLLSKEADHQSMEDLH